MGCALNALAHPHECVGGSHQSRKRNAVIRSQIERVIPKYSGKTYKTKLLSLMAEGKIIRIIQLGTVSNQNDTIFNVGWRKKMVCAKTRRVSSKKI